MNRREFMNWMGVGALATSLPVAIAACQSDTATTDDAATADATTDDAPREDGFAPVGTVSELDETGSVSDKNFQGAQIIVIRDPADASALIAVDSLCTHQGCTVAWEEGIFACPCHGSSFNPDGSIASGPAAEPLPTYEAKIEGDQVLAKV